MRVAMTKPLFAWDCLEDSPNRKTIRAFLAAVPDGKLLEALRNWRGHGQDQYPVHTLWGTRLLTALLRHPSIEACLADLRRNEASRRLIGIESEARVPKPWNSNPAGFACLASRELWARSRTARPPGPGEDHKRPLLSL